MLEASNLKTMESWYQNLSPYVNDKEFPLRGGKKDLPPVLIGLKNSLLLLRNKWKKVFCILVGPAC